MDIEIGDTVESLIGRDDLTIGKHYEVTGSNGLEVTVKDDADDSNHKPNADFKLIEKGKWNKDKFIVYGTRCDNKSSLVDSEEELKKKLAECAKDNGWTGRIIGYKLVPVLEAVTETRLKIFKKKVIRKITKKK